MSPPMLEMARHVIKSSWAVKKCWLCGSFKSPVTIELPAMQTYSLAFGCKNTELSTLPLNPIAWSNSTIDWGAATVWAGYWLTCCACDYGTYCISCAGSYCSCCIILKQINLLSLLNIQIKNYNKYNISNSIRMQTHEIFSIWDGYRDVINQ